LDETVVCGGGVSMSGHTCIVERRKDARRSSFFNQITNDLVIEKLDGGPLDLFSNVFFLLGLEGQLDKNLLQLLVDIVDAKLFE
jgi:hypothetical protein